MTRHVEVRRGAYQDSVSLMLVSQELQRGAGVTRALVAMATELNLDLLAELGFDPPADAHPNDLLVAIDADDDEALSAAREALGAALSRRQVSRGSTTGSGPRSALTVAAAARAAAADLVLVSTPGRVAVLDAVDAVDAGLDVMVFSDNVSVDHEVALKDLAARRGVLVMGPDCGTAVVGGVGLGFANVVRPGPVGIVAASGTGAQHLLCLLDHARIGVTHCLGVGGRDLSSAVAGRSTFTAMRRLDDDPDVELIVVISKPPAPEVAAALTTFARDLTTPVVMGTLGAGRPDLTQTAATVARALATDWMPPRRWGGSPRSPRSGSVRGLYSGGTLCDEAMIIAADRLGGVASNIPLAGHPALGPDLAATGHAFIDFGDDALTVGRPHPMLDQSLRLARLQAELADPACAAVLLDVVLGHGAHPDPADEIVAVIDGAPTPVVVALIGTRDDPQGLERQAAALAEAGAIVHASNAAAAHEAIDLVAGAGR